MPTVRLLGPVDVIDDDGVVHTPGSPLRCTLLALLALQPGTALDAETLLDRIWDGRAPASGRRALRFHVSRLRAELGVADLVVTVGSAYRLDANTDLARLDDGLAADSDADALAALLATRRGDPFLGASTCSALEHERRRLDELTLTITERLYQRSLADYDTSVIGDLTRLCLNHPVRESLWVLLIRAHYQAGNQADALRTAATLRINLREELGVDPSRELQQLELQILDHDVPPTGNHERHPRHNFGSTLNTAAGVVAEGQGGQLLRSLRTVDVVPGNLPLQSSSFVGRDRDVATIVDAVGGHRVVTLFGVAGVGKTRLAVQSAATLAPQFRDGAWLIELAPVIDGDGVDRAVAAVFMLQPEPARTWRQVVVDGLAGRDVLLVIDNCEHVLDDVAALVETLVACPTVRVLVTSRESLAVGGEWAWPVPALPLDAAVELFTERADTAASGFRPDDADLVVIGEICERLDAIPLAIELAAARIRSMSPTQIRDRLDERFRLLTGSRRSIERHQTLRHAVQWSYDLLEPVEQAVLQRVSVFVRGFSLDAATAITDVDEYDALDILDSLVRKSLLHVERTDSHVRYGMLETIRQFAEEALAATGTSDTTRDAHARYFADQTDIASAALPSEDEWLAYRFVDTDITNVAAAFHWALSRQDTAIAVRIAANSHQIARRRLRTETVGWPEQALDLARRSGDRQLPRLLAAACDAATGVGRFGDAVRFGLEAVTLNDDDRYDFAIDAYRLTGQALFYTGNVEHAMEVMREGAEHPADAPVRSNLASLHISAHFGGVAISPQETIDAVARTQRIPDADRTSGRLVGTGHVHRRR